MNGAKEYAKLFTTGQYGKLYITSSSHARGYTFRIQILPEGETAKTNGSGNTCLNPDAIEVYGAVSGNLGWTETYGWIHKGKWQEDFAELIIIQEKSIEERIEKERIFLAKYIQKQKVKTKNLLDNY
jgi:hypothetical protein